MKHFKRGAVVMVLLVLLTPWAVAADVLTLYAAGSLKAALGDVAKANEKTYPEQGGYQIRPQRSAAQGHRGR